MTAQRVRLWFRKGERVRYISHLDVLRYWERAFRRAELPLAYSGGFSPHPKLAFAGPLPLGFLAEADIVDATLDERVDINEIRERLAGQSSDDLALVDLREVPLTVPAPQASLAWADYEFVVPGVSLEAASRAVANFLERETFEWTEERRDKTRTYDLREGVRQLSVAPVEGGVAFSARVRAEQERNVRPEELLKALFPGSEASVFIRKALFLDEPSPAREARRRHGRHIE
jgi:radical SAM-linked protein